MEYTKLKDLIDSQFTVSGVIGYKFKRWNEAEEKMEIADSPGIGFRKLYQVQTDKGLLDLGTGQIGGLLEAVFAGGRADLVGRTFEVKSNGKTGLDTRYFFNAVKGATQTQEVIKDVVLDDLPPIESYSDEKPVNLDSIPF